MNYSVFHFGVARLGEEIVRGPDHIGHAVDIAVVFSFMAVEALVNEQAFDQLLNPIRAQVTMGLRALTIPELQQAGPPFDTLALVNHIAKEVLARANIFNSAHQIGGSISF